jgi:hypothetical protein
MISLTEKDQPRAWAAMQAALNISQPYQKRISALSTSPRHADRSFINGADVTEALKRTWTVMNRFFEYRKRGKKPLVPPDFPLLKP